MTATRAEAEELAPAPSSVSVVVCAYSLSRLEQSRRCVLGVLANERPPEELIVVVDNNDPLRERLRACLPSEVVIVANDGRGLSEGRNTGLRLARSEVVAFIDDDAWPDPRWLACLMETLRDERLIGVGGLVAPEWEVPERALPPELYWVVGSTYAGHRSDAGPITRPIGASMAARRLALLELGGFSAQFGRYGTSGSNEELATFSALAQRFGPDRIWFVPEAVVHHFAPLQRCGYPYLVRRSAIEGRSKADIRARCGPAVLAHDGHYARHVLFPAVRSYARAALRERQRGALRPVVQLVSCFAVTAYAYGTRRVTTRARAALGSLRVPHRLRMR